MWNCLHRHLREGGVGYAPSSHRERMMITMPDELPNPTQPKKQTRAKRSEELIEEGELDLASLITVEQCQDLINVLYEHHVINCDRVLKNGGEPRYLRLSDGEAQLLRRLTGKEPR